MESSGSCWNGPGRAGACGASAKESQVPPDLRVSHVARGVEARSKDLVLKVGELCLRCSRVPDPDRAGVFGFTQTTLSYMTV